MSDGYKLASSLLALIIVVALVVMLIWGIIGLAKQGSKALDKEAAAVDKQSAELKTKVFNYKFGWQVHRFVDEEQGNVIYVTGNGICVVSIKK